MRATGVRLALYALLALLIGIAAGCGGDDDGAGADTAGGADTGGPLVVNIAQAPATLDPAWGCGLYDIGFTQNFYVRLTQYGSEPGPEGTTQFNPADI